VKVVTPSDPTLSEALSRFVTVQKNGKKGLGGHQEISRFVAWCGRDLKVSQLSPADIADYAQYAGLGSADSTKKLSPVKIFLGFLKEEGWTTTGLAAHLRVPRGRRVASPATPHTAAGSPQLSQESYERLNAQLEILKEERVKVVEDIRQAMADKDFRENAPLEAAKERQGFIESKIRELEADLANAQILGTGPVEQQRRICVGTRVTLRDITSGKEVVYTLVDMREANVASGKISTVSPVGQALLNRATGEEVFINVPRGTLHYIIAEIGS
jgi:transcription elongation factor GreA